jgi:hypothetical protein
MRLPLGELIVLSSHLCFFVVAFVSDGDVKNCNSRARIERLALASVGSLTVTLNWTCLFVADQNSGAAPNSPRIRRRKASGAANNISGGGGSSPSVAVADASWEKGGGGAAAKADAVAKLKCPLSDEEEVVEVARVKSSANVSATSKLGLVVVGDHESARPPTMLHQQQTQPASQPGDLSQRIVDASSPLISASNALSILPSSAASDSGANKHYLNSSFWISPSNPHQGHCALIRLKSIDYKFSTPCLFR